MNRLLPLGVLAAVLIVASLAYNLLREPPTRADGSVTTAAQSQPRPPAVSPSAQATEDRGIDPR